MADDKLLEGGAIPAAGGLGQRLVVGVGGEGAASCSYCRAPLAGPQAETADNYILIQYLISLKLGGSSLRSKEKCKRIKRIV